MESLYTNTGLLFRDICLTSIGQMGERTPSNIPGAGKLPPKIPGQNPNGRPRSSTAGLPPIPGGGRQTLPGANPIARPNPSVPRSHVLVTVGVGALAAIFLFSLVLTPYSEVFHATSKQSIAIGLIAFFSSTVFHALYTLDEDASKSDGTFSEWKLIPRQLVEKSLLICCWSVGVVNLASMMTEIARSFS